MHVSEKIKRINTSVWDSFSVTYRSYQTPLFLEVVRRLDSAARTRGRLRLARDSSRRARVEQHRWRQRDGLVADHLAGRKVDHVRVYRAARGARRALELELRGLAVGRVVAGGDVVLGGAERGLASLATEVVLEVDEVALDVRDRSAAHNAELHAAFVAVLELDGVDVVRERAGALV